MNIFFEALAISDKRIIIDFFKEVFAYDTNTFTKIIDASIIAQQEIAIEIDGDK